MSNLLNWYEQEQVNNKAQEAEIKKPDSKIEQFMIDSSGQENEALNASMRIGKQSNPDIQSRVLKQQVRTGLDAGLIERNLETFEAETSQSDFDADKFRKDNPIVSQWLSDPENAKLAYDDTATLEGFEWLFRAPAKAFKQGEDQAYLAKLRFQQLQSGLSDDDLALADKLSKTRIQDLGAESWIQEAVIEAGRQLPNMMEVVKGGLRLAIPSALSAGGTALAAGQLGPQAALPEEIITVPAATTTGAVLGFRTGTASSSFELQTGFAYDEFLEFKDINGQPLEDDIAKVAAVSAGAINAGIEMLQIDLLAKSFPGLDKMLGKGGTNIVKEALRNPNTLDAMKQFGKNYAGLVTVETATEIAQEIVNMLAGEAAKKYQGEFDDVDMAQMGERLLHSADAALKASVILSSPGPTTTFIRDYAQTKKANQNKLVMESLGELTENSKTQQRMPEKLREVITKIKENGPVQDVMIPIQQWTNLFQSQGLDPAAVSAEVLGDNGANFSEATATGADLVIPLELYTEKLAGSQYHSMLLDDVRFHADEMTAREARNWESENQDYLQEAIANFTDQVITPDESAFIFDDVTQQLVQTGMEVGTAEGNAMQMQAAFRTLAERTGLPVQELWNRYGPKIKREMPESLKSRDVNTSVDPLLERLRAGDIPTEQQAYGPSMIDAIREKGIIDEGGELASRDIDVQRKPFQRAVIQDKGLTVDEAAQLMAEAGYINKPISEVTQNDLFEAIDKELSGDRVYSEQNVNTDAVSSRQELNELSDYLDSIQVDLDQMSNEQIRNLLLGQTREMDGETSYPQIENPGSENFNKWAGTDQVINPEDINDTDFSSGGPFVFTAYHGTTHDFSVFDTSKTGNKGGHFGAVNYFTSSLNDAEGNYLSKGTDLTNRIEQLYEQIENDPESYGLDIDSENLESEAMDLAKQKLSGGQDKVLEVYIKTENPFVVGDESPWIELVDQSEVESHAIDLVAENNDITNTEVKDNIDEYADEIDDARWEVLESQENKLVEAIEVVADRNDLDASDILSELYEVTSEGDVSHQNLEQHMRNMEAMQYVEDPETGEVISSHIIGEVIQELGFDSIILKDADQQFSSMDMDTGTAHIHIFDENNSNIKSVDNTGSFNPENPDIYQQEKRGQISISPDKKFEITFFDKSDLSTMLHESGHLYFEVLQDLEAKGEISETMKSDMDAIRNWVGAEPGKAITIDQHEQFARGFEAYLREGKAPTSALQTAFARFRGWLISIYRQISNLNVDVTPEIKEVFDRLLATDDEIKAAEQQQEYVRMFDSAEDAGMTEAEYSNYQEAAVKAHDDAQAEVAKKQMNVMKREKKKWWKEAEQTTRDEVMEEVALNPAYQSLSYLQKGEFIDGPLPEGMEHQKIDKKSLVDAYGKDFLKLLPRPYIYSVDGGLHQDTIGAMFGYNSGDQMLQAIMKAPKLNAFVKAETDRRMRERYGDINTDGTLPNEAMKAVHNEKRAEVLATEMRALARKTNSNKQPTPAQLMRQAAEASVSRRLVRNLNPNVYLRAERKAAKEALDLSLAKDYEGALAAKQRQMLNFYLGNAASKAKTDTDKARDYLISFNSTKKRSSLAKAGQDYIDQIDSLLEKAEFRKVSLKSLDRRQSLSDWIKSQEENGWSVDVPQELINQAQQVNYKDMSVESLLGMRDAVKNIDHLARFKNKLLAKASKRKFDESVNDITSVIYAENKITKNEVNFAPGFKDTLKEGLSGYAAWHTKMEFLFERLDGYKVNGPVWNALFKPIADAEASEQQMNERFTEKLGEILGEYTSKERGEWQTKKIHIDGIGTMTKETALSVALNWGNAGNRQAILDSKAYGWNEAQVNQILDLLTEKDWQTVQKILDMVNELWPDIAQLQKDLNGVAPDKVEGMSINTKYGEFAGGYFPLKYDTKLSNRAFLRDEKSKSAELFENNFIKPVTKKGHTIERVGSGGQSVKLSLSVIGEHMGEAIHDLTHRRAVMDVDRLISDNRVRVAIEGAAGKDMYRQLRPWLQSIANERQELFSTYEKVLGHLRTGATVVNMGLKVTTALAQPLGFLQTVDVIGSKYAMRGLTDFFGKPNEMQAKMQFAMDRSVMLKNRQKTFDRDVRDSLKRMSGESTLDKMSQSYFYFTGLLDMAVSVPTWLGAYRKAMDGAVDSIEKGNEQLAIDYADRSVRVSQSSGGTKDLARIQRGSQTFRLFTMFYSYFSVLFNLMQQRYGEVSTGRKSKAEAAASYFFLIAGPAVLGELIAARGPGEDEEPLAWAAKHIAMYPAMTVVGVRDAANALGPYGYSASPAFDAFDHTAKAIKAPFKDEITRSDVKSAVLAASYWGQLPGRQMWITGEYLYDVGSGDEDPETVWEFMHKAAFSRPASER